MEIKDAKILTRTDIQRSLKPRLKGLVDDLAEDSVMDVNTARRMARALMHEAVKLMLEARMDASEMGAQYEQAFLTEIKYLENTNEVDAAMDLSPVTMN